MESSELFGDNNTRMHSNSGKTLGIEYYIIQICSGITRGGMLNGDLYAQRLTFVIFVLN